MTIKLLTADHLKFLILKGGCIGSSESTLVKMPHCLKSHAAAHKHLGPNKHGLVTYIQVNVCIGNTLSWLNGG